jgi:hypothetical protein
MVTSNSPYSKEHIELFRDIHTYLGDRENFGQDRKAAELLKRLRRLGVIQSGADADHYDADRGMTGREAREQLLAKRYPPGPISGRQARIALQQRRIWRDW